MFNPSSVPRRAAVILPDAAMDLRPEGPLRVAQFTEDGVCAVVDLPSFGFAWVPKEANPGQRSCRDRGLVARGRQIRNESIEIEIDAATGGIRSVAAVGESTARLGQQLVMTGLLDAQGKPATSKMRGERFDLDYGGPALVQATSIGSLDRPRTEHRLASFTQRFRLWAGRPILEIDITLSDLERPGSNGRRRLIHGPCTWHAGGHGPTRVRCCDAESSGHRRSRMPSARKLLSISTFRPARNEPPFSSRGFPTIANTGAACSIRC